MQPGDWLRNRIKCAIHMESHPNNLSAGNLDSITAMGEVIL